MKDSNETRCACNTCPPAGCDCGCQKAANPACACDANCACGENCRCAKCADGSK